MFYQWQFDSPDFDGTYLQVKPKYPLYLPQTKGATYLLVRPIYEYVRYLLFYKLVNFDQFLNFVKEHNWAIHQESKLVKKYAKFTQPQIP